jgi:hypothetical protein
LKRSYGVSRSLLSGLTCSRRLSSSTFKFAKSSNLNIKSESIKVINPATKTNFKRLSKDLALAKIFLKGFEEVFILSIFL